MGDERECKAARAIHVSKSASHDWLFLEPRISNTGSHLSIGATDTVYNALYNWSYETEGWRTPVMPRALRKKGSN